MTTLDQLLDTQRLDRITAEARQVQVGRTLLTVLAAVLFGVGWIVARTVNALWLGLAWSAVAVKVGWVEGRRAAPRKR